MTPVFKSLLAVAVEISSSCHQFSFGIDLVITHIYVSFGIYQTDQLTGFDLSTGISTDKYVSFLFVMKDCFSGCFPVWCIAGRTEFFVVVVHFRRIKL